MRKCNDKTQRWGLTYWNQMLVLIFGQLDGYNSLRELTDITTAHAKKSFHLGFGKTTINRSVLSKANQLGDYHIFEEFAYHMVALAQKSRIDKEFELKRTFTYYTNNFFLKTKDIAFLYKNRWIVEIFFKWMKGHLRIKSFWGNTENAVRIQVYVAIITY